eukprot:scaffold7371_cov108-Amphora_coffeaeformis.AAC.1
MSIYCKAHILRQRTIRLLCNTKDGNRQEMIKGGGGGGGDRDRIGDRFQVDRSERVGDRGSDVAGRFAVRKGRLRIRVQRGGRR